MTVEKIFTVALGKDGPIVGVQALDMGINLIDAADMCGIGRNEELSSKLVRARRNKVCIATKSGIVRRVDKPYFLHQQPS